MGIHPGGAGSAVIVLYAGRRPSDDDFPASQREFIGDRIAQLLAGLQPRLLVGSAAAGADLLALERGLAAGAHARVILAGGREDFRASSVVDRGEEWGALYDQILVHPDVHAEESGRVPDDDEATYKAATERLWERAEAELGADEGLIVLVVARRREGGGYDHSEELVIRQELRGGVVLRLDPLLTDEEAARAFVAMPFGNRPWPQRELKRYRSDLTYGRILLPALLAAGYEPMRADTQAMLEVIDAKMLAAIANSDLLIADLATENPNVMWELGVRHAWRPSGTVLIAPADTPIPFDVARVPVHLYRRGATQIADADCIEALRMLAEVLADVAREDPDSPVFIHLPDLAPVELPAGEDAEEDAAAEFLERITLAADLRRVDDLLSLAAETESSAELHDSSRPPLREQLGLALIDLSRHGDAAAILRPLAEADAEFSRSLLQEQFAHALIRDPAAEGRDERLAEAELRLQRLIARPAAGGEAHGLLASAAKARAEIALASGSDPLSQLAVALDAYESGMRTDPGDYYPGINAVALYRLRGQHLDPNDEDLRRASELLPVVRFAVLRGGIEAVSEDLWASLTLAECALHELLLGGNAANEAEAREWYGRAAARALPNQRRAARSQLELFDLAGDPEQIVGPLLSLFRSID